MLEHYGPVSRFWFDGKGSDGKNGQPHIRYPAGLNLTAHFETILDLIRSKSPSTIITGYREWGGDLASSYGSLNLYDSGPIPNTTSMVQVGRPSETGTLFYPNEQVGLCMFDVMFCLVCVACVCRHFALHHHQFE